MHFSELIFLFLTFWYLLHVSKPILHPQEGGCMFRYDMVWCSSLAFTRSCPNTLLYPQYCLYMYKCTANTLHHTWVWCRVYGMKLMCTACNMFWILCNDGLMTVWWQKVVGNRLNNRIFLCLTEKNIFIIVFQEKKFRVFAPPRWCPPPKKMYVYNNSGLKRMYLLLPSKKIEGICSSPLMPPQKCRPITIQDWKEYIYYCLSRKKIEGICPLPVDHPKKNIVGL
jgi:hypothetical protein